MIEKWNAEQFRDEIMVSGKLAAVEFYSDSCPACRTLGVVLDRVAEKYENRLSFGKVNVNHEQALAEKYAIRSVPTLMIFCEGRCVDESVGSVGQGELVRVIDSAIERVSDQG